MHRIVKILGYYHLEKFVKEENPKWHLCTTAAGQEATFCDGQFAQEIEDIEGDYKTVEKGGITCKACLEKIREIKAIKL